MIRSVKIVSPLNQCKLKELHLFFETYQNCVNYFIARLWSEKRSNGSYLEREYIRSAKERFDLTARFIQCAGKQSLEIVKSQRKKTQKERTIPRFKQLTATLDGRIWEITDQSNSFEWIKLQSGIKFYLPFKRTKLWNKWEDKGFALLKTLRLYLRKKKLTIEFIFKKETPKIKSEGEIEGLDLGYVNLAICSDGQELGNGINNYIKSFAKREKHTHKRIKERAFQELKKLDLTNIKALIIENLKNVKSKTRGMFSRAHNRRMSHWLYAKVTEWLGQRCEEIGVQLIKKSPWKTSQYCRFCGKWDKRNRNGLSFHCVQCGHSEEADLNASRNLKLLGLAEVYSLRSLQNGVIG